MILIFSDEVQKILKGDTTCWDYNSDLILNLHQESTDLMPEWEFFVPCQTSWAENWPQRALSLQQTSVIEKNCFYIYFSTCLRGYHLDRLSNVAKNANSSILWWNNHIIRKRVTNRIYLTVEYGLRDPHSSELQSTSRIEEL